MDRIAILGCGGSGKTTVGLRLAAHLDIPLTHLDAVYYDADWNALPLGKFAADQEDIVAGQRWIIDGNYAASMPIRLHRADTVIFLDISPIACLWGILQRRHTFRGGQHADQGVYDRITWSFIRFL